MARGWGQRSSVSGLLVLFGSCLACLYVAGRLWGTTRELHYVQTELQAAMYGQQELLAAQPRCNKGASAPGTQLPSAAQKQPAENADILYYSLRAAAGDVPPLQGMRLAEDLPVQQPPDDSLLGAIEAVESGEVSGWACHRNSPGRAYQVLIYVDGIKVGATSGGEPTPHLLISRLCEGATSDSDGSSSKRLGFRQRLPPLPQGRHEVRAFIASTDGSSRQELNQSPLKFIETAVQTTAQQKLARKDSIIRVRNAQVSSLWDELHNKRPWQTALDANGTLSSFDTGSKQGAGPEFLAVIAINTGFSARDRRDMLRQTWVPTGEGLLKLQRDHGIVVRFVVGRSDQADDPMDKKVQAETKQFGDIIRLDSTDTYADLSGKTLKLFSKLPDKFDASFYFKADDDIIVDTAQLAAYLRERRHQGNLYMGCMKSGAVLTNKKYKWYEPDAYRFGDGNNGDAANYMRHASGQFYGVSAPVARYIKQNAPILHRYANEDITVGTWMLGLDVEYVHERRMCCANADECNKAKQSGAECLAYFEMSCAGICDSEQRLVPLYKHCVLNEKQSWSSMIGLAAT